MEKIYVGKIVSTHGIKGEIRIISDNEYKDRIFKVNNKLIIDDTDYIIKSYRHHKNYEMVTLNDYNNINDVLFLMKKKVYFNKDDLNLSSNEVYFEDLINYKVKYNNSLYEVSEVFDAGNNKIIRALINDKEVLIPYNSPMIKEIDKENKEIIVDLFGVM